MRSNKVRFDGLDLYYNKEYNAWQGSKVFGDWKTSIEWAPSQTAEKNGYKINITIDKNNIKTKILLVIKIDNFLNNKNNFEINCDFNTLSGTSRSRNHLLQSKIIKDDIGLFKNRWKGNLEFNLKG
ncbi:MAG: hypothetical protein GTO02_15935 [Candidatus Dadabacteria bacterium]|nr:hypothetical protein [Candidatus Dadabacteria bacterium]